MRARRAWVALALAGGLALAGCSAGDGDKADTAAHKGAAAEDRGTGAGRAAADQQGTEENAQSEQDGKAAGKTDGPAVKPGSGSTSDGGRSKPPPLRLHVIRTAELQVEVADVEKAIAQARRIAEARGGFVSEENSGFAAGATEDDDGDGDIDASVASSSLIVIRVPQEQYDATLTALARGGKVVSRETDAKDVTDEVVDVESRIASQRASVARVRALMERAERLTDVVALEGELGRRQADLESLLAQQSSLKNRTALSTITLDYREPRSNQVTEKKDDDPSVGDAVAGGWDALVATVRWTAIVIGAVLPFLLPLALGGAVWWSLRRRALRRGSAPEAGTGTDTGTDADTDTDTDTDAASAGRGAARGPA
ncbi:DUF4349 domain-containing protein [Streptomyces sp. NPDC058953]|uniref:DUF4349 domain-containing protein n=1 Tax=unclassified Streptomyces TaxID=2593676 RepID=UPI0036A5683A